MAGRWLGTEMLEAGSGRLYLDPGEILCAEPAIRHAEIESRPGGFVENTGSSPQFVSALKALQGLFG